MNDVEQLRVLFVIYADIRSASAKHAYWFAEQIAKRGHEAMVALRGDSDMLRREEIQPQPHLQFVFHRFIGPSLNRHALRAVEAFRPMAIHVWSPMVPTIAAARAYWRLTRAPLFGHWEDDDWTMRRGMPGRPPHRVLGHEVRRLLGYPFPSLGPASSNATGVRWIARRAVAMDALTPALADEVEARLGRSCAVLLPVTAQHGWGDTDADPSPIELPATLKGRTIVTYTGTIGPSTVHDLTISLAAIARLQASGRQVAFVHAGTIAPRYDVPRLVRDARVDPDTVAFLGYLPFVQIPRLLSHSDVLIQPGPPSRFNRLRLPSKLQAYLASGVPTITFAAGFGEMLEDRRDVLKLHTADPAELAQRLADVMDSGELARSLGEGGRVAARRLFDPDVNTEALLEHYRSGLTRREAGFITKMGL